MGSESIAGDAEGNEDLIRFTNVKPGESIYHRLLLIVGRAGTPDRPVRSIVAHTNLRSGFESIEWQVNQSHFKATVPLREGDNVLRFVPNVGTNDGGEEDDSKDDDSTGDVSKDDDPKDGGSMDGGSMDDGWMTDGYVDWHNPRRVEHRFTFDPEDGGSAKIVVRPAAGLMRSSSSWRAASQQ
ncbi:unnamed protein product [Tilletia laevis]|uniref:Uncharacterized protein n=2 Tax=Tilletia TaxID=13289 RepID=A0A177USQ6_9BASI|nr:hypothetical protein CF336_g3038 [Tilletia laevis]KAE8262316.1 hypothetical protein A4X03_0g2550 [Tilletia caries]KAE8205351.1 hypothetical protein CF335_g2331 [Tilletia laevis]CAD6893551.1 unnamed protein product [Tilletia caries]CAD6932721.1 unnamed protein product [Tilletia laevis]